MPPSQFQEESTIVRRYRDLGPLGLPCVPCVGVNRFTARVRPVFHRHVGCFEIIFNANGACEYVIGGKRHALKPDDVLAVPPDTDHTIAEYPKGLRTFSLLFRMDGRAVPGLTKGESQWLRQQLHGLPLRFGAARCGLRERFLRVLELAETGERTVQNRIALRTATTDLLLAIVSAAARVHLQPVNRRLQDLAVQMKEHPEARYPLARLARENGLSANALLAQFRAMTGFTPHAYLMRCRIDRAMKLLPHNTNAAVARQLGFSSPQHFAAQFLRQVGIPPRAFAARRTSGQ